MNSNAPRIALVVVGTLIALSDVHAFDSREVKFLGSLTLDAAQGDRIPLSSGDSVSGAQGWGIRVGLEAPNNEAKTLFTQLFVGYKTSHGPFGQLGEFVTDIAATPFSNHRYAELARQTFDLLEQYRFYEGFRAGVGATYHHSPRARCVEDQAGACDSISPVTLDNAWGAVFQLSHVWSDVFELGVRYTHIDYKTGGQRFDASGWGLFMVLGFHLPR